MNMEKRARQIRLKSDFCYQLHEVYLDYFNNFLTIEAFAEYYGFSLEFAQNLIKEAKRLEEQYV